MNLLDKFFKVSDLVNDSLLAVSFKYFSATLVKCLLKMFAISASRVKVLLLYIIEVIFTTFFV